MAAHPSLSDVNEVVLSGGAPTDDERSEVQRNTVRMLQALADTPEPLQRSVLTSVLVTVALSQPCPWCFLADQGKAVSQSLTLIGTQPAGHA